MTPKTVAMLTNGTYDDPADKGTKLFSPKMTRYGECQLNHGMAMQFAFGSAAIAATPDPKVQAEQLDKFIMQGLKEVTMHEVGHTLGLRHNFKASKWLSIKDMNDPEKSKNGIVASVMDYSPANIVPKDWKQGDYYTQTVGPYDYWAIQYGYTPYGGGTAGEVDPATPPRAVSQAGVR